jgi:hypothetical protein
VGYPASECASVVWSESPQGIGERSQITILVVALSPGGVPCYLRGVPITRSDDQPIHPDHHPVGMISD